MYVFYTDFQSILDDNQLHIHACANVININATDIYGNTPSVNDFKGKKSLLRNCIVDCLEYENISIKSNLTKLECFHDFHRYQYSRHPNP